MLPKMIVMWSAASLGMYILVFLNKYLAGSIYVHYYIDGVTGILGFTIGIPIYAKCRIRVSFIIAFIVTIVGALGIFLFESEIISPNVVDDGQSPYPEGSHKDKDYKLAKVIPYFSFIAKLGANLIFSFAY
jgi:hypothetical protein